MIVAKVGNNEIYTPVEFRRKGLIKKTMESHQDFSNLDDTIAYVKRHNDIYEGLVDLFEFHIGDKIIKLLTKLTYEEIFTWNPIKPNQYFFGKKDKGSWEYRKHLRTASESYTLYKNPEGSKYRMGHPDPIIDAKILYDVILYPLAQAERSFQSGDRKHFEDMLKPVLDLITIARKRYEPEDWNDFNEIIEYFETKKK